jgi:hypothetical protein
VQHRGYVVGACRERSGGALAVTVAALVVGDASEAGVGEEFVDWSPNLTSFAAGVEEEEGRTGAEFFAV